MTYDTMTDRELNAAVAEKVMGFKWHLCHELNQEGEMVYHLRDDEPPEWWKRPTEIAAPDLPEVRGVRLFVRIGVRNYSTSIADAFEVVEKMMDHSPLVNIIKAKRWHCCLTPPGTPPDVWDDEEGWVQVGKRFHAYANTAPRAICIAALMAVEKETP